MNYEIQFAKITCSGKLPDRFLSCQHSKTSDITKSSMGETFSLIEILSPWYNSAQIGQMIINNFANEYYKGGSTSDLVNFENALKKINENLAQITQNGETEWIGNLNSILATIVGDSLILSSAGKTEAYLLRDGKVNHLTYGLTDKVEVHPLKTFSNIISGQLKTHDKILLTNKALFNHLSLESLRQIITLNNPSVAALQIAKLLRKSKVKNVNLIIISLISKEELTNVAIKENLENVFYLDKTSEPFFDKVKSVWQTILSPIAKIVASKSINVISNAFKATASKIGRLLKRKTTSPQPTLEKPADNFQKEFIQKDKRDDHLLKDEEIKYSPDYYVHYYQEKKAQKDNKFKKIYGFLWETLRTLYQWFLGLYHDRSKRKYFYIIIAIILILIIGLVVGLKDKGGGNIGNLEAQKILDEAIAAQKDAKKSLSSGNTEKAKEQYLLSIDKAQIIQNNPLVKKDAEVVVTTSYQELDKLTSTIRYQTLEPMATISDTGKAIFIVSGEAFIVSENDIYKASILGGKPQKVSTLPKNKGNFICGTAFGNTLYLYTSNQNLFEFSPSSEKIEQVKIAEDGRWETANSIASYIGSLYLLDGVLGQIYKHSSDKEIFARGEEYIAKNSDILKESISLAIDGSIYVLKNDGEVLKLQRSKLQDFSIQNIPSPQDKINEPRKIYTDSDTPSLYILDAEQKRILEFDKEGFYVRQYALPQDFEKIVDFYVSYKSKKIWILNDNSLYEIPI